MLFKRIAVRFADAMGSMGDPRDRVEIEGVEVGRRGHDRLTATGGQPESALQGKKFLSLWFSCATVYGRAYPNAAGTEYCARCGKCGKTIEFPIGEGGTSRRMFEVSCQ